jgi:hypothetical protein
MADLEELLQNYIAILDWSRAYEASEIAGHLIPKLNHDNFEF